MPTTTDHSDLPLDVAEIPCSGPELSCDVLVVGAGPAGSSLARRLARAGLDVVLADRQEFPRHKPCGDFLSPACLPLLEDLGVADRFADLLPFHLRGMRIDHAGGRAVGRFRRPGGAAAGALRGFGIRREVFDDLLVRAAREVGVRWLPRHAFVDLCRDRGARVRGARLRQVDGGAVVTCRARWVVGADGVHSRVARALGVQRRIPWLDRFALVTHYRGVAPGAFADVHLLENGFAAATTVDEGLFGVNLIVPRGALGGRGGARDWDDFFARHVAAASPLGQRLAGAERAAPWRGTGPFAFTTSTPTVDGAALVGDASGYLDPLTGEGVYFALYLASELADALIEAVRSPARSGAAMARYRKARRREVAPRLRCSALLHRALRHPWLVRAVLGRAARWPALADLLVTLSGDTIHPRDLRSPVFWRRFWRAEIA